MNEDKAINVVPAYIKTVIFALISFYFCSFLFFLLVFKCYFGWNRNMFSVLKSFIIDNLINPTEIFSSYALCFALIQDLPIILSIEIVLLSFTLLILLGIIIVKYATQSVTETYQVVFASQRKIAEARLFSGEFHFLGMSYNQPLRLPFNSSVLSFTAKDSLKAINIATPSIFNDNDCNMVIIDCSGKFQKISAGYRTLLGKTLCYDWENKDEKSSGKYFAAWNPLSSKTMPGDAAKRDKYISTLANAILSTNHKADEKSSLYLQCIISFFIAKMEKATANDYFLNILLRNKYMDSDDRAILMSYYLLMPDVVTEKAKESLAANDLTAENYVPVGSWENITEEWQGRELNLSLIYDSLQQQFTEIKDSPEASRFGLWKVLLRQYSQEAELFNYPDNIKNVLSSLSEKISPEDDNCFSMIMEGLSVFNNQRIREKTIFSDFSYEEIRGFRVDDSIYPMTLYLSARTNDEKTISKIMLHMLINEAVEKYENQNPLVFLIDDTQGFGYVDSLINGLRLGERANVSFLIFNNDIDTFRTLYDEKTYQAILSNCEYLMFFADTPDKHKKLLSAGATPNIENYLQNIFISIDKLAKSGDDNALLVVNNEDPVFIQTRLLSTQETKAVYGDSIVPAVPYVDDFIKAGRPAFFETFSVPKPFEKKKEKRGRKKKTENEKGSYEWWLDDDLSLELTDNGGGA